MNFRQGFVAVGGCAEIAGLAIPGRKARRKAPANSAKRYASTIREAVAGIYLDYCGGSNHAQRCLDGPCNLRYFEIKSALAERPNPRQTRQKWLFRFPRNPARSAASLLLA